MLPQKKQVRKGSIISFLFALGRMIRINRITEPKLAEWQKRTIAFNRCLLDLKLKKKDFQKTLESFQEKYPDSSYPVLLTASALLREKKSAEAQALLEV